MYNIIGSGSIVVLHVELIICKSLVVFMENQPSTLFRYSVEIKLYLIGRSSFSFEERDRQH